MDMLQAPGITSLPQRPNMEKKIPEDFSLPWKPLGALMGVVTATILMAALVSHRWETGLVFAAMALVLPVYFRFMRKLSIKDMTTRPRSWMLTDDGLMRVYNDPPERETIRWSHIQRMRWMKFKGLDLLWEESTPHHARLRQEFREADLAGLLRGSIAVGEKQADEIAALWLEKRSLPRGDQPLHHERSSGKTLSRRVRRTLLLGTVMGLALIGWATVNIVRQYPSCSWPSVDGKVISQQYRDLPKDPDHSAKAQLFLAYEYAVDGRPYHSEQYSLWHPVYVEEVETVQAFARTHKAGSVVRVSYNPKQPTEAVLLPGPDWRGDTALLVLGAFFLLIMLVARVAMLSEGKTNSRRSRNALVKEYGP